MDLAAFVLLSCADPQALLTAFEPNIFFGRPYAKHTHVSVREKKALDLRSFLHIGNTTNLLQTGRFTASL